LIDVLIPIKNPSAILIDTIESLASQIDKNFNVILSDNYSNKGNEFFEASIKILYKAGIKSKLIRPKFELSRIQHWNYLHSKTDGEWLKPLFVGDILLPEYIQVVRKVIESRPQLQIIRCNFEMKGVEGLIPAYYPFEKDYFSAQEFRDAYPKYGNWLGGPINFIYTKNAWQISGGYMVEMPACADLQLYTSLAAQYGLYSINTILARFQLHANRFSFGIRNRKVNGFIESFIIFRLLKNFYKNSGYKFYNNDLRKGLLEVFKNHYISGIKGKIKLEIKKIFWN